MATAIQRHPAAASKAGDLTEEQIDALLAQATARLYEKSRPQSQRLSSRSTTQLSFPKLNTGILQQSRITIEQHLTKVQAPPSEKETTTSSSFRRVEDPLQAKRLAKEKAKATAGPMWFDLPKTDLTPELKRDLQLLKMRGVLDPHRHYKKENGKMVAPEYSMVGTITEGATEFYTGRVENKKRKQTFVEEVLSGEQETGRFKKKYGDIQVKKSSGKKSFYNALKAKRYRGVKKGG